jgi:hypothetical protein
MKTVMDNHSVAHVWAQQRQSHAHSKSMSFRDSVIYSYRTPIGMIVKAADGSDVALITNQSYSMTTSCKHMPAVRSAVRHLRSFSVSNLVPSHAANLAEMVKAYHDEKPSLLRKRDLYRTPQETLEGLYDAAREYAEAFGLPVPELDWLQDGLDIEAARNAREAKNNTPQAIAAKERARQRAADKVRASYRNGDALPYSYRASHKIEALMDDADRVARAEAIRVLNADKIAAWHNGEGHIRFDAECGGAALRVVGDELQTSHGARVPLEHAVKAFRFIKMVRERGEGWHHNGHSLRVGHFTVDAIQPNGDFKAGCHDIRWAEVERIARLVGVFDAAPSDDALTLTYSAA